MLQQIFNTVVQILSKVGVILTVVSSVQQAQAAQATETTADQILSEVGTILSEVENPSYGLNAIQNAISTLSATNSLDHTAILDAIAALPQVGNPVVLPTTPPAGYGGASAGDIWNEPLGFSMTAASQLQLWAGWLSHYMGYVQFPLPSPQADTPWALVGDYSLDNQQDPQFGATITLDYSTILASDATSAEWLLRVHPEVAWSTFTNGCLGVPDPGGNTFFWIVWLPQAEWDDLKNALGLGVAAELLPPVWPGLDLVTFGTAVPIDTGVTITTPMHGVVVALTSVPPNRGSYLFDDKNSYLNLGALAFFSDNDDEEHPQNFGFTSAVYLVRTMKEAAGVKVRAIPGLAGTVTPFLIS